jgi:5-methylcytosine-specific restriction endonuclease McrA
MSDGRSKYVICYSCLIRPAVVQHHIRSRSRHPVLKDDVDNMMWVCNECHEAATRMGDKSADIMRSRKERAMRLFHRLDKSE